MAKKSARSKGYRTYKKVEKGFTKQEITTMIVGFAVIVLVIVGAIVLPDLIESRHLLKVVDGVVQAEDNWLVRDVSSTSKHKYRKIAEVEPAEGYQLSSVEDGLTGDTNEKYFYYEPIEDGVAQRYFAMAGNGEYNELAQTSQGYMGMFANEVLYQGDIVETEIDGMKVAYYLSEYTVADTTAQEEAAEDAEPEATAEPAEDVEPEVTAEPTEAVEPEVTAEPTEAVEPEETAAADDAEAEPEDSSAANDAGAEPTEADETPEAAEADEAEPTEAAEPEEEPVVVDYYQTIYLYIDSPIDGNCVVLSAENTGDTDEVFADRDAMEELILDAAKHVTMAK